MEKKIKISLPEASVILIIVLAIMGFGVIGVGLSPQVLIMLATSFVILWSKLRGFDWKNVNGRIKDGIEKDIVPIFIFILIGAMISTWIAAGTIPTLMVVGFKIIGVRWFLPSVYYLYFS